MIYDAFLFRDEWTCLDVRMHELEDVVDHHILVEADWTFQGDNKALYFTSDAYRRALGGLGGKYSRPIRCQPLRGDPFPHGASWAREAYAREAINEALGHPSIQAADDDYVILGDVDELPAADVIEGAIEALDKGGGPSIAFKQEPRFYRFDNLCTSMDYKGSQLMTVATLRKNGVERMRGNRWDALAVPGGWHFCNLGDADAFIRKLKSFAHEELNTPENTNPETVDELIRERRLLGDTDYEFTLTDEGLPAWVLENRDQFKDLFYEEEESRWPSSEAQAAAP